MKQPAEADCTPHRAWLWLRRGALVLVAVLLLVVAGYGCAPSLLSLESHAKEADVIVVLGGETPRRVARCAELFHQGAAPRVVVTGGGDATIIKRYLLQAGVPAKAITLETESSTTRENAQRTAPLLAQANVRRAFLVTSWFHMRRAVACFRHYAPEVAFYPAPSVYSWAAYNSPRWEKFKGVYREYGKILGYLVRFGIFPFVSAPE
ncbi:MAG TPA: YdcF family protein [Verrucomicrobiae bacterium]|jgi:uncharacterized SAM-binding protein YcdF (DUF218 family)